MKITDKIKENHSLKNLTTFKVGGPAEFYIETENDEELIDAIKWAKAKNLSVKILGGGSNILISDAGVKGLVIKIASRFINIKSNIIESSAGCYLAELLKTAYDNSLSGLEWAIGIPGTVGGAIRGNAGAFGSEIGDSIIEVTIFDWLNNNKKILDKSKCNFSYRESIFKNHKNFIILKAVFSLKFKTKNKIEKMMDEFSKRRHTLKIKKPCAGSIFKNISIAEIEKNNPALAAKAYLEKIVKENKVPAGWLIDLADIQERSVGDAAISDTHNNIIINKNEADSGQITALISLIKMKIRNKFNINLQEEIEYFGF